MAEALSILLFSGETDGSALRYALKADAFSVNFVKTPVQTPLPQGGQPILLDFGHIRPTITISGLVDTTAPGSSENVTGPTKDSSSTYIVPSKENLEDFVTSKFFDKNTQPIEVIISDGTSTSVAEYRAAISQARFDLAPATEDRFAFTLVFSSELRKSGT